MRFGVIFSIMLHLGVVYGMLYAPWKDWAPDVAPEPVVPIQIIAEAELAERTSVPAMRKEPEPQPEPEPEPEPEEVEPEPEPEPQPAPEPEPQPAPEPEPKVEAKAEPEATPAPKPEAAPKPKPKPKPKNDELDLDALSALVDKEKEKSRPQSSTPSEVIAGDRDQRRVGAGDRLTASEEAKMRAAVSRCWNASAIIGAPEPEKLKVVLEFELNRDGTINGQPRVSNAAQINLSGNRFWKVAEQNALRAVVACQPYNFLNQDRYDTWKEFELHFDPSMMAGF